MTNIRKTLLITLLLSIAVPAAAQKSVDEIVKPRKKQSPGFYIKAQYNSPSINMKASIENDIDWAKAMGVMSHSTIGASLRIPVWSSIYIQPEFFYSIVSDWETASLESNFFKQTFKAFKNKEINNFDIPINIGARWEPAKAFAARVYLGAMLRMQLAQDNFNLYENYFLRFGLGIDLLNFLIIDAGYSVEMNKLTIFDDTDYYFIGLGIKL